MTWVLHEGQLVSCQTLHATDAPIGMHRTLLFRCQHVLKMPTICQDLSQHNTLLAAI